MQTELPAEILFWKETFIGESCNLWVCSFYRIQFRI